MTDIDITVVIFLYFGQRTRSEHKVGRIVYSPSFFISECTAHILIRFGKRDGMYAECCWQNVVPIYLPVI
jgi:hypothetical protein